MNLGQAVRPIRCSAPAACSAWLGSASGVRLGPLHPHPAASPVQDGEHDCGGVFGPGRRAVILLQPGQVRSRRLPGLRSSSLPQCVARRLLAFVAGLSRCSCPARNCWLFPPSHLPTGQCRRPVAWTPPCPASYTSQPAHRSRSAGPRCISRHQASRLCQHWSTAGTAPWMAPPCRPPWWRVPPPCSSPLPPSEQQQQQCVGCRAWGEGLAAA